MPYRSVRWVAAYKCVVQRSCPHCDPCSVTYLSSHPPPVGVYFTAFHQPPALEFTAWCCCPPMATELALSVLVCGRGCAKVGQRRQSPLYLAQPLTPRCIPAVVVPKSEALVPAVWATQGAILGTVCCGVQEMKMTNETRKIWDAPDVMSMATCIRVPVMRAHAESINIEFEDDITEAEARDLLAAAPGVSIIDDRCAAAHPQSSARWFSLLQTPEPARRLPLYVLELAVACKLVVYC